MERRNWNDGGAVDLAGRLGSESAGDRPEKVAAKKLGIGPKNLVCTRGEEEDE